LFSFFSVRNEQKIIVEKTYDIPAMIEYFALDAADVATIQSWNVGTEEKSPVIWSDKQLQWDEISSTYIKRGTAQVTIDGMPRTFSVILSGTKIVVNHVQLNLQKSASVQVFDFEKIVNTGGINTVYMKCDNSMPKNYGTLAYSVFIPNKKEAWVAYSWQCLKGECSANINIYYEKEKVEKLPCY
jgi:hypothetical protein